MSIKMNNKKPKSGLFSCIVSNCCKKSKSGHLRKGHLRSSTISSSTIAQKSRSLSSTVGKSEFPKTKAETKYVTSSKIANSSKNTSLSSSSLYHFDDVSELTPYTKTESLNKRPGRKVFPIESSSTSVTKILHPVTTSYSSSLESSNDIRVVVKTSPTKNSPATSKTTSSSSALVKKSKQNKYYIETTETIMKRVAQLKFSNTTSSIAEPKKVEALPELSSKSIPSKSILTDIPPSSSSKISSSIHREAVTFRKTRENISSTTVTRKKSTSTSLPKVTNRINKSRKVAHEKFLESQTSDDRTQKSSKNDVVY